MLGFPFGFSGFSQQIIREWKVPNTLVLTDGGAMSVAAGRGVGAGGARHMSRVCLIRFAESQTRTCSLPHRRRQDGPKSDRHAE